MSEVLLDGRMRRATELRASRKAELLRVALRVFAERGYHQTRISDIIEAAEVARGTFYLYFESKSAMFLELLDALLEELRASVVGVDIGAGTPGLITQLEETTGRILDTVARNRLLARIIVREAVGLDAAVEAKLRDFYSSLTGYIESALDVGHTLGLVRPVSRPIVALCILGTIKQVMEHIVSSPTDTPIDTSRWARSIVDYGLHGVGVIHRT